MKIWTPKNNVHLCIANMIFAFSYIFILWVFNMLSVVAFKIAWSTTASEYVLLAGDFLVLFTPLIAAYYLRKRIKSKAHRIKAEFLLCLLMTPMWLFTFADNIIVAILVGVVWPFILFYSFIRYIS